MLTNTIFKPGSRYRGGTENTMEISERKKQILQAIVDDYTETAEPVGSRSIVKRHSISLSPATIRNEMADLEDMGFLQKPHTSAGRIPSGLGYRYYVNSLMNRCKLSGDETERMRRALEIRQNELDSLIAEASGIVSRLTAYTVIASSPHAKHHAVKNIKLLPMGEGNLLLALMTNAGLMKNMVIKTAGRVKAEIVFEYSTLLSDIFLCNSPHDISEEQFVRLCEASHGHEEIYSAVIGALFEWFEKSSAANVFAGGVVNIFNHPEYKDIDKAKEFIRFLDDRNNISGMLEGGGDETDGVDIKIGDENGREELSSMSVLTAKYNAGRELSGRIGIIGPMRMDYARVVSTLEVITDRLNTIIGHIFDNDMKG